LTEPTINLIPLKDDFYQFQADVLPEEQIIAKIMREHNWGYARGVPFEHISLEENQKIDRYELIQFFKAYKTPIIHILLRDDAVVRAGGPAIGEVLAEKTPTYDVHFQKVGQAQLWYSNTTKQCILWECLFHSVDPEADLTHTLKIWRWVLAYIKQLGMEQIYTHDFDPAYPTDYPRFLKTLGFKYTGKARIMMIDTKETDYDLP